MEVFILNKKKNPVIFVEMNQKELMGNGIWVA